MMATARVRRLRYNMLVGLPVPLCDKYCGMCFRRSCMWASGLPSGGRGGSIKFYLSLWDESDEGGDDRVGTHMYVGAVVTRRTWDWTDTEGGLRLGKVRMVGSRGGARPTGQTSGGGHNVWKAETGNHDSRRPGWYFHRYPWSPLGRQADFEAARAMEAGMEFEQTLKIRPTTSTCRKHRAQPTASATNCK